MVLNRIVRWVKETVSGNLDVVKGSFYVVFGTALSALTLYWQHEFRPLYVSSIFKVTFDNSTGLPPMYKSTSGYLYQEPESGGRECTLRVILPFDFPPPTIPKQYLCPWRGGDQRIDSLCYTHFHCEGPSSIVNLFIAAASLFLISYIILGGVVFLTRSKILLIRSKPLYWGIVILGLMAGIGGFWVSKTIPYLTDLFLEDVFDKIRLVTVFKGGVTGLTYEAIHYILDFRTNVSRTLLDVLAGFSLGFIFIVWETYKRLFKLPSPL
jgi:hypothetical protein